TDKAHFVITLTSLADFSSATVSMRVYVQSGSGGTVFNYVQDSGNHFFGVPVANRPVLGSFSGWTTMAWNVGAQPDSDATGIVKTSIKRIGIEVNAAPSSLWADPTVVYVDSITVKTPTLSFTFDAASSITASTTADPAGQLLWLASNTLDTTATGT